MVAKLSKHGLIFAAGLAWALPVHAAEWGDMLKGVIAQPPVQLPSTTSTSTPSRVDTLSQVEINDGLKEALTQGAEAAVSQLGRHDGFFGDPKLRIPLPPALDKADKAMRMFGMGQRADDLVLAMNRAAESVVPEAKMLLVDAVKNMTLEDAKGILTGGKTSATDFFRRKTESRLTERFTPVVKQTTDKVGLAQQYNSYAGMAAQYKVIDSSQARVEDYVTQQSLDRLYTLIGEKEAAIRSNPLGAGSDLLKKVFGAASGR